MMSKKQKIISKHFVVSAIIFVVLIIDQITKFLIRTNFEPYASKKILSFFSLTYLRNTGISFGLLKGANTLFLIISILIFGFFMYIYLKRKKYPIQFGLIFAGTLGNLIDRFFLGYVVDFIDFHYCPVFNIADSAISIGMIWLLIILIKNNEDLF